MMLLLKLLLFGHVHRWKILDRDPLRFTREGEVTDRGMRYTLQCEKCGDVAKRDLI